MASKVTLNLNTGTWDWDINLTPGANTLLISFTDAGAGSTVQFDDISMEFEMGLNGQVVQVGSYPPPGVKLISTDQEHVCIRSATVTADDEISVKVTIVNGGVTYESEQTTIVPRPDKPYDSWVWDDSGKSWEAPVAYPDDGLNYVWDEPSGSWVESSMDEP